MNPTNPNFSGVSADYGTLKPYETPDYTKPVDLSTIGGGTPAVSTTPTDNTNYKSIISGVIAGAGMTNNTQEQTTSDKYKTEAENYTKLLERAGLKDLEQSSALNSPEILAQQQQIQSLKNQLSSIEAESQAGQLTQQGTYRPQFAITADQRDIERQAAIKSLTVGAQLSALQGNLQLATDQITKAIDLKYKPIETELAISKQRLEAIKPFLDAEQKAIVEQKDREYTAKQNEMTAIKTIQTQAIDDAQKAGQSSIAQQIASIDPSDVNAREKIASLIGQIPSTSNGDILSVTEATSLGVPYGTTKAQAISLGKVPSKGMTAGVKDDIATMDTVISLGDEVLGKVDKITGNLPGVGGLGFGSIAQFLAKNVGVGSKEGQDVRNSIGNIQGTIAKLRGGTSFTPNEQALLETYVPTINDSSMVIQSKLGSLRNFINTKKDFLIGNTPVSGTVIPLSPGSTGQTSSGVSFTVEK